MRVDVTNVCVYRVWRLTLSSASLHKYNYFYFLDSWIPRADICKLAAPIYSSVFGSITITSSCAPFIFQRNSLPGDRLLTRVPATFQARRQLPKQVLNHRKSPCFKLLNLTKLTGPYIAINTREMNYKPFIIINVSIRLNGRETIYDNQRIFANTIR